MKTHFNQISGAITAPLGFLAAGVFCGIKGLGTGKGAEKGQKRDLALLISETPAVVAGLFTTNQVCAAPVKICIARAAQPQAQAIVVNSGNANACTGAQGLRDAQAMTEIAARRLGLAVNDVLVCSTGRIGVKLPMKRVKQGILAAADLLNASAENGHHLAEAIMTSDTKPKEIAVEIKLNGKPVRIAGVAKGAGMIQPGMSSNGQRPAASPRHATMLCFITTDAAIDSRALKAALNEAVSISFNRITIDGDMSTNDSVIALANGMARNPLIAANKGKSNRNSNADLALFQAALNYVTLELAKMIVRDGEGASRFVTVNVSGAASAIDADAAARAVANSALVKTSWCGGDPNWGRIMDALGYSAARVVEDKVDIAYSAPGSGKLVYSLRNGQPTKTPFKKLCQIVAANEFDLRINLNLGAAKATVYACDLTEAYVDFNKGSVGDPSSLGG